MPWGDSVLNIATSDQAAFQMWQTQGTTRAATERAGAEPMQDCEVYKNTFVLDPMPSVRDAIVDIVIDKGRWWR